MPEHRYETVHHQDLSFDWQNPRIPSQYLKGVVSHTDMTVFLYHTYAVSELATSMALAGYFPQDPMTVTREHGLDTVLDGNRRLAAIRVLTDPELAAKLHAKLPEPRPGALETLGRIPIFLTDRRSNWRRTLKTHAYGRTTWHSRNRADYIHHLHQEHDATAEEIAEQTGYNSRAVRELYRTAEIVRQAQEKLSFNQDGETTGITTFSRLHQALRMDNILSFIGLPTAPSLQQEPVQEEYLPQLAELLLWLCGDQNSTLSVIQDSNQDLAKLDDVIGNPGALEELRKTRNLHRTYDRLKNPPPTFEQALETARKALSQAENALQRAEETPKPRLLGLAREIAAVADNLSDRRRHAPPQVDP